VAVVEFTRNLQRFFPTLATTDVQATSVRELVTRLEQKYPGLSTYLVDDLFSLRQHVNIFVDGTMIQDREKLSDKLSPTARVHIIQALSGG
jgi:sulfur-carrier protein